MKKSNVLLKSKLQPWNRLSTELQTNIPSRSSMQICSSIRSQSVGYPLHIRGNICVYTMTLAPNTDTKNSNYYINAIFNRIIFIKILLTWLSQLANSYLKLGQIWLMGRQSLPFKIYGELCEVKRIKVD